jgi:uncharacterized protein YjbI with pentapeptide repeats
MPKTRLNYHNSSQQNRDFVEDQKKDKLDYIEANFSDADLQNAIFSGLKLYKANFSNARLNGANFRGAYLQGADFSNAYVDGEFPEIVDFSDSHIQGTIFYKSQLSRANFKNATAGLIHKNYILIITFLGLFGSAFTASIVSTFLFHFFIDYRQDIGLPGKKPSFFNLIRIFLISGGFITVFRIIINHFYGSDLVGWHITIGICLIVFVILLALFKTEAEANFSSLVMILVIGILPALIDFLFHSKLLEFEVFLNHLFPGLINGLGEKTNGVIAKTFIGAITGPFLGCCISSLAICKDERIDWLNFEWLWKWYLMFAVAGGTNFKLANLSEVDFTSADLKGANFEKAAIEKIDWFRVKHLDCAYLGKNNYLNTLGIRYLLVVKKWKAGSNFDGLNLKGINLENANLENASFIGTDLSQSNLRNANLINANLKKANLDGADLSESILTGACIESWSISEKTQLNRVKCEHVFLKEIADKITGIKLRLPNAAAGINFEEGDFEALFKKDSYTLQLFIRYTDSHQALRTAFQLLKNDTNLLFKGFEIVGKNAIIKYRVSQSTNKDFVLNTFYQNVKETQANQESQEQSNDRTETWLGFILDLVRELMSSIPNSVNIVDSEFSGNIALDNSGWQTYTQNREK